MNTKEYGVLKTLQGTSSIDTKSRYWLLTKTKDNDFVGYVEGVISVKNENLIVWSAAFFNPNSELFEDVYFTKEDFLEKMHKDFIIVRAKPEDAHEYIRKNYNAAEYAGGGFYIWHTIPILICKNGGSPIAYFTENHEYFENQNLCNIVVNHQQINIKNPFLNGITAKR